MAYNHRSLFGKFLGNSLQVLVKFFLVLDIGDAIQVECFGCNSVSANTLQILDYRLFLNYCVCKSVLTYIATENAQLFVTTHSMDAIREMLEITKQKELNTLVHHFILKEGSLETRTTPGLDAKAVVDVEGDIRFADEYV